MRAALCFDFQRADEELLNISTNITIDNNRLIFVILNQIISNDDQCETASEHTKEVK